MPKPKFHEPNFFHEQREKYLKVVSSIREHFKGAKKHPAYKRMRQKDFVAFADVSALCDFVLQELSDKEKQELKTHFLDAPTLNRLKKSFDYVIDIYFEKKQASLNQNPETFVDLSALFKDLLEQERYSKKKISFLDLYNQFQKYKKQLYEYRKRALRNLFLTEHWAAFQQKHDIPLVEYKEKPKTKPKFTKEKLRREFDKNDRELRKKRSILSNILPKKYHADITQLLFLENRLNFLLHVGVKPDSKIPSDVFSSLRDAFYYNPILQDMFKKNFSVSQRKGNKRYSYSQQGIPAARDIYRLLLYHCAKFQQKPLPAYDSLLANYSITLLKQFKEDYHLFSENPTFAEVKPYLGAVFSSFFQFLAEKDVLDIYLHYLENNKLLP